MKPLKKKQKKNKNKKKWSKKIKIKGEIERIPSLGSLASPADQLPTRTRSRNADQLTISICSIFKPLTIDSARMKSAI